MRQPHDFVKNSNVPITFLEDTSLVLERTLYLESAPNFQLIKTHPTGEWLRTNLAVNVVEDAIKKDLYLRIKYKSREEKITTRTISKIQLHKTKETLELGSAAVEVVYLEAYCHLRDDVRFFRLDRILTMQQLNLKYK